MIRLETINPNFNKNNKNVKRSQTAIDTTINKGLNKMENELITFDNKLCKVTVKYYFFIIV